MKKYFYPIFLTLSLNLSAETQFSIAPSLLFFDYTEFGFDDNVLNNEAGAILGIQSKLKTRINDQLKLELTLDNYDGNVDYSGYSQQGTAINTNTDETLLRYGLRVTTPLHNNTDIFLSTTSHQWKRNIHGTGSILGIFEKYEWQEISLGVKTQFWTKPQNSWFAEAAVLKIIKPKMYIDLSSADYGSTNLNLGAETGVRFQLSWLNTSLKQKNYGFNVFYEAWDFGVSESNTTKGGATSISVYEPRSETQHFGIQFLLGFLY